MILPFCLLRKQMAKRAGKEGKVVMRENLEREASEALLGWDLSNLPYFLLNTVLRKGVEGSPEILVKAVMEVMVVLLENLISLNIMALHSST